MIGDSHADRRSKGAAPNSNAGASWSRAVGAELKATHEVAVPEITVRTQSGIRTRLDWVTVHEGKVGCIECKASPTAPFTTNQASAFPEIAETGAVVVGKGKPGMPGGTIIPPTEVDVRRP
jgi:filamentous hemagglutinin